MAYSRTQKDDLQDEIKTLTKDLHLAFLCKDTTKQKEIYEKLSIAESTLFNIR